VSTGAWVSGSLLGVALVGAYVAQMVRWLRVLQREHYEPSSMRRFLGRWSTPQVAPAKSPERSKEKRPITLSHVLVVVLVVATVLRVDTLVVLVTVLYGVFCPQGLSMKGRTSKLQWTRRLTLTAIVATIISVAIGLAGFFTTRPWLVFVAMVWAVPVMLDVTSRLLAPYERHHSQKFVDQAVARLAKVKPRIVAITGSYGKTSTKNHLADLLRPDGGVVASPRSFNNRSGLSRAINENLVDGTRVFIAEMGTYGPGEIRELCSWCPPELAVVTAIGPVHLERMKSLEVIEQAKYEVTERAATVVVNIDDLRLLRWVERLTGEGKRVRTAGSMAATASVRVIPQGAKWSVVVDGETVVNADLVSGIQATNLACAIAAALELGLGVDQVAARVGLVETVANRSNVVMATSGVVVIDDTFNANPASALAALTLLGSLALSGRRVVVTPGLVELGDEQYGANMELGRKAASVKAILVAVGRTNVKPLQVGYASPIQRFDTRDEAVSWVRATLVPGDGVLYLNDLPDHYP
jgi:UDP-N-acetylmuramoyl-tripeptide--D-alanyl-D-alanine ligase